MWCSSGAMRWTTSTRFTMADVVLDANIIVGSLDEHGAVLLLIANATAEPSEELFVGDASNLFWRTTVAEARQYVPTSGSYSSVLSSKLIPMGSCRNKIADTLSNREP